MSDTRAVTSPIEYVLTFAIAAILIVGLIVAATGQVESQRSRTVGAQMDVVGHQLAGSLEVADRQIRNGATELTLSRDLPDEVLGASYTLRVESDRIVVSSPVSEEPVTVGYQTQNDVVDGSGASPPFTLEGGQVTITLSGGDIEVSQ